MTGPVQYMLFALAGYLSGSILYSYLLPKAILGVDITEKPADHNPGAANVFMQAGVPMGLLCVSLDILKGFAPVFIAFMFLDRTNWLIALVIVAPVLGHAFPLLNIDRGGKGIATSFGTLLGLLPGFFLVFVLAFIYLVMLLAGALFHFGHTICSILVYLLFAAGAVIMLGFIPVTCGCVGISGVVIYKHAADLHFRQTEPQPVALSGGRES